MSRRAVEIVGITVLTLAIVGGCGGEVAPAALQRLLESGTPATLGIETRLATGPTGSVLFTEIFESDTPLPSFVRLPRALSAGAQVMLNYRYWDHPEWRPLPGVRVAQHSVAVAVDRSGREPRAPLVLTEIPSGSKVRIQVIGFPIEEPTVVRRYPVTIPPAAILEFGYGIREESWFSGSEKTRFSVALVGASGERSALLDRTLDPEIAVDRRWFDARIDLGAYSGRSVTLEFETTRLSPAGRPSLPVWSDPVVYSADAPASRPNVLVISIDTLRSRSLGTYGYLRDTSPFIDSLAAEGAVFENAITTSVTTAPSHMSLFTGLYPVHHGIRRGNEYRRPEVTTLPQVFRTAGYHTAAFTENGYLLRPRGFGDGFSQYTENRARDALTPVQSRITFEQARDWLAANQRDPFLLFVHTYQVHTPYQPKPPYSELFADDGAPGPEDPDIRNERDNYDREIRAVDDELRRLFAVVAATRPKQRPIAVVLADHGEEFLEHGMLQHGGAVFDETLRIPLIFWSPGRIPAGVRVATPVSLIDVAPTLMDLAGLEVPATLDGRSLRGALRVGGSLAPRRLFAEAYSPRRWVGIWRFESWNPPLIAVRSNETKFIVHRPQRGEIQPMVRYDLVADPLERSPQPVSADQLAQVNEWVDAYLRGAAAPGDPIRSEEISPDVRDHLRALGYGD